MNVRVVSAAAGCLLCLMLAVAMPVRADSCCEELTLQLRQQSERIRQLEETVRSLQSGGGSATQAAAAAGSLDDPLVGTWQCTNNVFTYNMTFFADGLLLQESTTFGPMRQLSWTRVSKDEVLLPNGIKLRTSFSGADNLSAENLNSGAAWDCQRVQR